MPSHRPENEKERPARGVFRKAKHIAVAGGCVVLVLGVKSLVQGSSFGAHFYVWVGVGLVAVIMIIGIPIAALIVILRSLEQFYGPMRRRREAFERQVSEGREAIDRQDVEIARRILEPLAKEGDDEPRLLLSFLHAGALSVPHDDEEAVRMLRAAAGDGYSYAQYCLSERLRTGKGVSLNDAESTRWLQMAAEQGDVQSQFKLGFRYAEGAFLEKDRVRAYMWLDLAAVGGKPVICRDRIATDMTAEEVSQAQQMTREWQAAHPTPSAQKDG